MKISHTLKIQEDGLTISGRITGVEWGDSKRGDEKDNRDHTENFFIKSFNCPELCSYGLCVRGDDTKFDNIAITHTYKTKDEAKAMMDFILENTIEEGEKKEEREPIEGEEVVAVSDRGIKIDKYYLCTRKDGRFVCYGKKDDSLCNYHDCKSYKQIKQIKPIKPTITIDGKKYLKSDIDKLTPIDN